MFSVLDLELKLQRYALFWNASKKHRRRKIS